MTLTLKASIAGALALTLAGGAAFAQPARGVGAQLKAACKADFQKYCPNMGATMEFRTCVRKNFHSLSKACQAVLMKMQSERQQQDGDAPQ